jgi:predicted DNA-binding transcriptional regulator AlpA
MELQLEMTMTTEADEILTTAQVAIMLGVTQATVGNWLKSNLGYFPNAYPLSPQPHSPWRIPKSDVTAFIERRRKERGFFYMPVPPKDSE